VLLLNTFVAVSFSAFEETYSRDALERRVNERYGLMVAFELACAGSPDSRLHFAQWHALWSRLNPRRAHYSRIVFKCLDQDNLSNLDLFEFFRLSDVVHSVVQRGARADVPSASATRACSARWRTRAAPRSSRRWCSGARCASALPTARAR
jgi:hypothetical protein